VKEAMGLIKERSILVEVTEAIADSAADIAIKYGLHALDALIYACAMKTLMLNSLPQIRILRA